MATGGSNAEETYSGLVPFRGISYQGAILLSFSFLRPQRITRTHRFSEISKIEFENFDIVNGLGSMEWGELLIDNHESYQIISCELKFDAETLKLRPRK